MASLAAGRKVPIALLYQAPALHAHLKQALTELGARVVYDTPAASFDRSALSESGAEVVVINLDPDVDEEFEQLGDLLADEQLKVIFNDGEVSSRLEGWDQARWARHLAAKILGVQDTNPPRPAGASAIPVKVKATSEAAASEDRSFELHGHELAAALSADTADAISKTRAALVTKDEPVAPKLVAKPGPGETPTLELPVGSLLGNIPESGFSEQRRPAGAAEPPPPTPPTDAVAAEFDSVMRDFGFLDGTVPAEAAAEPQEMPADALSFDDTAAPQAADAVTSAKNPFDALAFDEDFASEATLDATVELQAPSSARAATASPALGMDDFSLDFELPAAGAPGAGALEDLSLEDSSGAAGTSEFDIGALQLEDLDLPESAAANAPAEVPRGLDDMLDAISLETHKNPVPTPVAPATKPATAAEPAKPASAVAPPAARPSATPAKTPVIREDFLASLSLEPVDENDESPKPPATAKPAAAAPAAPRASSPPPESVSKFDLSALSLEPIDEDASATPAIGRASFKVDESPAKPASPAPAAARGPGAAAPASASDDGLSLEGLDFDLDEITPIEKATSTAAGGAESDPAETELMAELEAMVAQTERAAAAAAAATAPGEGPVKRVWVLGASIGGPEAVREFVAGLPPGAPALFLLAQHMGADFQELMTQQLARATSLRVRNVVDGDNVAHGEIVIVPIGHRLRVDTHGTVRMSSLEASSPYSPSIDQVLMDVADRFGADAGAIIFSGMAHDAIDGSVYLAQKGGKVWVQDPATCVISSMVDGARDAGVVSFTGSPVELAQQFQIEFGGAS